MTKHSVPKSKHSEDDIIKVLEFLIEKTFMFFICGKGFPADNRYTNRKKLCPSSSQNISQSIWSRIYTVFALNGKETVCFSFQFHVYRYIDEVCQLTTQSLIIIWAKWILLNLRSDKTERNTSVSYQDLLMLIWMDGQLHTSIYGKRDDINLVITNFCSWVAIFELCQLMLLYLSASICPGLLLGWMLYSEGDATFQQASRSGICHGTLKIVIEEI